MSTSWYLVSFQFEGHTGMADISCSDGYLDKEAMEKARAWIRKANGQPEDAPMAIISVFKYEKPTLFQKLKARLFR